MSLAQFNPRLRAGESLKAADVRLRLKQAVHAVGSIRKAAALVNVSPQYLCAVLHGEKSISPRILKALSLRRRVAVTYEAA